MERDVGSDQEVGYDEQSSVPAEDAVNGARVFTTPTGDAVNGARVSTAPVGDAVDEGTPHRPVDPPIRPTRTSRIRHRADTDVSAHRSTRLAAAVLLPFFVLIELPRVIARFILAASRRCRRALSSVGSPLRRSLARALQWLARRLGSAARWLRFAAGAARAASRLIARFGSGVGGFLAPAIRASGVALDAIRWVVRAVSRAVGWVLARVARAIAVAALAVGTLLACAGRAIWRVALRVGRALAVVLTANGRVVRAVAVAIGWVVRAAALAIARVMLGLTRQVLRATVALAAASAPLRHAMAAGSLTLYRLLRRSARTVGRTVVRSAAPFGRLARLFAGAARDVLAAGMRPLRRAANRLRAWSATMVRALAHRLGAWANAGRSAHASARRHARRLAHTTQEATGILAMDRLGADPSAAHVAEGDALAWAGQLSPRRALRRSSGQVRDGVDFHAAVSQNAYLELGGDVVDAVVTVSTTVARVIADVTAPPMAEVILLDCSGSMGHPARKMAAARRATQAAVEALRDGVAFAIVRCTGDAEVVYPNDGRLALASPRTREEAKAAAESLEAGGGTAMARWLLQARDLFIGLPDAIHHALLLTDGRDEGETGADLAGAVDACAGEYQCDCRGVGTDWDVAELRHVAAGLLGSVDIIPDPAGMEADFRAVTQRAMNHVVDSVDLHIWTPKGARVDCVRQITPSVEEVVAYESPVDPSTHEYPTGAWGREARQFHIRMQVEPRRAGTEMLAARVRVVVGQTTCAEAKVLATWTDDPVVAGYLDPVVARATGRAELASAIRRGLEARRRGDEATATVLLGRAVQLAAATDNRHIGGLLAKVVDVHAPSGTVTLRRHVPDVDEKVLDTRSTKTVRTDR
jgi:hypothetical protein